MQSCVVYLLARYWRAYSSSRFLQRCVFLYRGKTVSLSFLGLVRGHIMYLIRQLQTWLLFLLIIRALVVQRVQYRELTFTELSLLPSQSSSIDRLNQTSPSPDPDISANRPAVFCDATEYGRDLVTADCRDAITGIKRNRQRVRFGERSADPGTWDVGLPSRQIGGRDAAEENPPV